MFFIQRKKKILVKKVILRNENTFIVNILYIDNFINIYFFIRV